VSLGGLVSAHAAGTVSAAMATTASSASAIAATSTDNAENQVIPLTDAQLPKGMTADERKDKEQARNLMLREKCKDIPVDTFERYQCQRLVQLDLIQQLDEILASVKDKQARWTGVDVAAEQNAWLKQRDACHQAKDVKMCLEFAYLQRIGQLQAQFGLVPHEGPVSYACDGIGAPLVVSFESTNPPLLVLEQGGQHKYGWMLPTSGGVNFAGADFNFRELKGGAEFTQGDKLYACRQLP
jgi:hypothetical protein